MSKVTDRYDDLILDQQRELGWQAGSNAAALLVIADLAAAVREGKSVNINQAPSSPFFLPQIVWTVGDPPGSPPRPTMTAGDLKGQNDQT